MLYNKAPYARGEDDFRGLRALALRLAPKLFAAWELLGADTPNFKVHLKNHGVHFEHVYRTHCPPLADAALKRSPSVRTSPYTQNVLRGS